MVSYLSKLVHFTVENKPQKKSGRQRESQKYKTTQKRINAWERKGMQERKNQVKQCQVRSQGKILTEERDVRKETRPPKGKVERYLGK